MDTHVYVSGKLIDRRCRYGIVLRGIVYAVTLDCESIYEGNLRIIAKVIRLLGTELVIHISSRYVCRALRNNQLNESQSIRGSMALVPQLLSIGAANIKYMYVTNKDSSTEARVSREYAQTGGVSRTGWVVRELWDST